MTPIGAAIALAALVIVVLFLEVYFNRRAQAMARQLQIDEVMKGFHMPSPEEID